MRKNSLIIGICLFFLSLFNGIAQDIIPGAERTALYFPLLQNKKVGIVTNHTGVIKQNHIVDSLLATGVEVRYIFSPEHGFRGIADAGKHIKNSTDKKTGLPVISLYGSNKKPKSEIIQELDIVVFDIQDVGVRFYTYISTLHYVMEACGENGTPLLVLDRPNPNGYYVDGPILEPEHKSFVGMHPIPIVHGLTVGELAKMINGEKWIKETCKLTVIKCDNYSHEDMYDVPVAPSPNLPNMQSIYLYPSLGLFEGTVMSVGRGTEFPFQIYGHPNYRPMNYSFLPLPGPGASNPKHMGKKCYGVSLRDPIQHSTGFPGINLQFLLDAYVKTKTDNFFNSFFTLLAGTEKLQNQIENGESVERIRNGWIQDLTKYMKMREKYLLYDDFQ